MPFDRLNFSRRAHLKEWMDDPCSYAEFRDCLRDLERVNHWVLAYRPTLRWIESLTKDLPSGSSLNIVDVGCGGGDMLRQIQKWATKNNVLVQLTGIDLNPYATRAAREFSGNSESIKWITGDAFSYSPASPVHCVVSSLFTHHLSDSVLVQFVAWMDSVSTYGWFINDLHRQQLAYHAFKTLAAAMHWHPFVRHDGPISIRRGFQRADWVCICTDAGVGLDCVKIEKTFPARLCVSRIKYGVKLR